MRCEASQWTVILVLVAGFCNISTAKHQATSTNHSGPLPALQTHQTHKVQILPLNSVILRRFDSSKIPVATNKGRRCKFIPGQPPIQRRIHHRERPHDGPGKRVAIESRPSQNTVQAGGHPHDSRVLARACFFSGCFFQLVRMRRDRGFTMGNMFLFFLALHTRDLRPS